MKKILLFLTGISIVFAANTAQTAQKSNLNTLLKELEQFQKKMVTKNVTLASNSEIKKLDKEIRLLIKRKAYLRQLQSYHQAENKTLNNLKELSDDFYYLLNRYLKTLKVYYFYKNDFVIDNKREFIIGEKDLIDIAAFFQKEKGIVNRLKKLYKIAKIDNSIEDYNSFLMRTIQFLTNRLDDKIIYSRGNDRYVSIDYFKSCKYKLNEKSKMFIIKGCNFE